MASKRRWAATYAFLPFIIILYYYDLIPSLILILILILIITVVIVMIAYGVW